MNKEWKVKGKSYGIFNTETKTLLKKGMNNKHLLWKFSGVPAIDKKMYDTLDEVKKIVCVTEDTKFEISGEKFYLHMFEVDYGFGKQYVCHKEHWNIEGK